MKVILAALLVLGFISNTAQAATLEQYASGTATPTTIGSFDMTDFALGTAGTATSYGSLDFVDKYGNPQPMTRSTADATSWWNNGEASNYDVFLTDQHLITILLPENTRAFSFSVGADLGTTSNNAWLTATETSGSGISKSWFNVSRSNTPGFGIYTDSNDCSSAITSVTIDPVFWGFGNFSINQSTCTSVPESNSIYLLVLGLFGLFFTARRKV